MKMDSLKKPLISYSAFFAKSKTILLVTLCMSLLMNLVLFLRIPSQSTHVLRTYSEETFTAVFKALPHQQELHVLARTHQSNATFKSKRMKQSQTKHQTAQIIQKPETHPSTAMRSVPTITKPQTEQTTPRVPTQPSASKKSKSACPRMTMHQGKGAFLQDTICRPHLPAEDACEYAAEIFELTPSIAICHDQKEPPYQLCRVSEIRDGIRRSAPDVKCDVSACLKTNDIRLLIVDPSDGNYMQMDLPGTISNNDIEDVIEEAIEKTQSNGFNFMFIDCIGRKHRDKISQLLTFLPSKEIFTPKGQAFGNKVNVNIILLDSISRPHFYRSLRKTVSYLREKSADPSFNAHIFDFELFQSIHGHTHENEHALFGGSLYPENFTKSAKEYAPTNMERLFGIFKDAGYQTMAQNDLCWKAWYGFLMSFMTKEWTELQKKMKTVIDSTGITDAACKILQRHDKTTSFSDDEDHQICYNGKHHHTYLFHHLIQYLKAVTTINPSKPLFSYTETNVAHDDVGIRVQTLDQDLIDLIDNIAQLPNTFTIIYADHGNTYTEYQATMLEGRFETYHPILLGILPKELGRKFGKDVVENLRTNQYRLLHLFDIRESLVELASYDTRSRLKPVGIFREIPKNRTCDDLKLSSPNFCICEGWDIPVENSTAQVALAEFAIGQLNNQLENSLLASRGAKATDELPTLFGACQRLQLKSIKNVRQRQNAKGNMVTTIDVKVQSGNIVDQEELIAVQVESAQRPDSSSFEMRLVTFNRISHYSIYEQCADPGLPVNLCICNKRDNKPSLNHQNSTIYDIISENSHVREIKPCLLLVKRSYSENEGKEDYVGVEVYEFANICSDKKFTVRLRAEANNVRSSTELPLVVSLPPISIYFASVMMTEVGYFDTKLKLKLQIVADDLQRDGKDDDNDKGSENGGKRSRAENEKEDLRKRWRKIMSRTRPSAWKRTSNDK